MVMDLCFEARTTHSVMHCELEVRLYAPGAELAKKLEFVPQFDTDLEVYWQGGDKANCHGQRTARLKQLRVGYQESQSSGSREEPPFAKSEGGGSVTLMLKSNLARPKQLRNVVTAEGSGGCRCEYSVLKNAIVPNDIIPPVR